MSREIFDLNPVFIFSSLNTQGNNSEYLPYITINVSIRKEGFFVRFGFEM